MSDTKEIKKEIKKVEFGVLPPEEILSEIKSRKAKAKEKIYCPVCHYELFYCIGHPGNFKFNNLIPIPQFKNPIELSDILLGKNKN